MRHIFIIFTFSLLLLTSPLFGQSSKPLGVVIPPTVMGNVSNSRKQILLNTLDEEVSKYFDVSPTPQIESGELHEVKLFESERNFVVYHGALVEKPH